MTSPCRRWTRAANPETSSRWLQVTLSVSIRSLFCGLPSKIEPIMLLIVFKHQNHNNTDTRLTSSWVSQSSCIVMCSVDISRSAESASGLVLDWRQNVRIYTICAKDLKTPILVQFVLIHRQIFTTFLAAIDSQ